MFWRPVRTFGLVSVAAVMLAAMAGCETLSNEQQEPEVGALPIAETVAPGTLELVERALAEGRFDDAGRLVERVLLVEPENWKAQLLLAELHLASGDSERAAPIFESLVDKADVGARALQGLGIALTLQGVLDRGVEILQQAVAQDPGLWRAWNALGYYHDSNRDWAAAADSYGQALEGNPDSILVYNNRPSGALPGN